MAGLNSLVNLIKVLTPEEVENAKKYLHSFHRWGEKHGAVKLVKLYEVLTKNMEQPLNENEVIYLVYGQNKGIAFDKLVLRLRDKIFETLLLDLNVHREDVYANRNKAMFDTRKRISVGQIMIARGRQDLAEYLFNYAIDDAKKYELFDELLIAQKLLMGALSLTKGMKEYNKQMDIFRSYRLCRDAADRAQFAYNEFCVKDAFTAEGESVLSWLQKTIKEISKDYAATQSATIKYYQFYLEAHYYERLKDIRKQKKSFECLLELLNTKPAVFTRQRKSIALVNLACCEIRLMNFDHAIDYCSQAEILQKDENFNMGQSKEFRAQALYYRGEFEKAEGLLDELLGLHYTSQSGDFHTGRRLYLKACCLFMQRKFAQAHKILMEINPIESDAEGWNVAIRIMLILTMIEMLDLDGAGSNVKNLYYHLNRLSKEKDLTPRTKTISEVLIKLEKNGFQFNPTYTAIKGKLESLHSNEETLAWQALMPEMLPVHVWFYSKIFRQPIFPFNKKIVLQKQLK